MLRLAVITISILIAPVAMAEESICYGTTDKGRLENAVRLPLSGSNFTSYSTIGWLTGRTYLHSTVKDIVVASYDAVSKSAPGKDFVYGETGWASGGRFRPHKTHQNGLSIDFMVPVLKDGRSMPLPGSVLNKFGYAIEFDAQGNYEEYRIDYEAMAEHLYSLYQVAGAKGIKIRRVIFDLSLQPYLFKTSRGAYLKSHLTFSQRPAWVRHDEHYHVDFDIPCKALDH